MGRYSFIAVDPFDWFEIPPDGTDGLSRLAARLSPWQSPAIAGLPPFQGGAAGLLGYDLARSLETVPAASHDDLCMPALAMGLYDLVLAFDHLSGRAWAISQGFPELGAKRLVRARNRLALLLEDWLTAKAEESTNPPPCSAPIDIRAPQHAIVRAGIPDHIRLLSDFSPEQYVHAVRRVIDYILAGDVFQVNLSQRLRTPATENSLVFYQRLRAANPAPFAGYFDLGRYQLLSASPERFLRVTGSDVETRPIKGTRRRSRDPVVDAQLAQDLLASEKDRAENVMIVDLLRNDLSRVCQPETVRVSQLCGLERYEHVMHLVSAVHGTLAGSNTTIDLLRAAFPGGSITGAPKVRAMEIIAELEPTARGAYCGSLGYIGFNGNSDLNILIRTITAGDGSWQMPVGGGVVAQSDPAQEYEETWAKAEGMLRAIASRPLTEDGTVLPEAAPRGPRP